MNFLDQLDYFYSANPTENWLEVLGKRGHYHFGKQNLKAPDEDIMDFAVRYLYPLIPDHCTILDCGCGWGGPATLLANEKRCKITGATISKAQYNYIKNNIQEIDVIHCDLDDYVPKSNYDLALFMESFGHLQNPRKTLKNLYGFVDKILISEFFSYGDSYYDADWKLNFRSKRELEEIIYESGYRLKFFEETLTPEDVVRSAQYWLNGISKLKESERNDQIELLETCSQLWVKMKKLNSWSVATFYAEKT